MVIGRCTEVIGKYIDTITTINGVITATNNDIIISTCSRDLKAFDIMVVNLVLISG
jgi:hypothetical protein